MVPAAATPTRPPFKVGNGGAPVMLHTPPPTSGVWADSSVPSAPVKVSDASNCGAGPAVVKDQVGPVVDPFAFRAVTRQKYRVFGYIAGEACGETRPVAHAGGGLTVPNATSYVVAPVELHCMNPVIGNPVDPSAGARIVGTPGAPGAGAVLNDQIGPVVEPFAFRAVTCQKYCVFGGNDGDNITVGLVSPVASTGACWVVPMATS